MILPLHDLAGFYHDPGVSYAVIAFFLYSFLGWVMECIVIRREKGVWENRGFAHSPFCVIYGVGAMLGVVILRPFAHNLLMLYLAGALIATLFEYVTGVLMLRLFGELWWDYKEKPFNYKGILCLESTLGWGLIAVLLFTFLHRIVTGAVRVIPVEYAPFLALVLMFGYLFDFFLSMRTALRRKEEENPVSEIVFRQ